MDIDVHSHAPEIKAGIGASVVTHDDVMRLFEEFKAANDERLDEITRKSADVVTEELSLVECPAFSFTLLHELWLGHEPGINGFANLSALLMAYFGARFGVLGVYVTGRTREKQASSTGEPASSLIGQLTRTLVKKK
jgi:hypothetical protein